MEFKTENDATEMPEMKSFTGHLDGMEEQELQEVGLRRLPGVSLSNTQLLEQEMMGSDHHPQSHDNKSDDEEDIEIDMCEDTDPEDASDQPDFITRAKYPDDSSQSSKLGKYPDGNITQSQSRSQSLSKGPPIPPKGTRSITTDMNLRNAFRSRKPIEEMTLEELQTEAAYETERAILESLKSSNTNRPTSPDLSDGDFESADEAPESTLPDRFKASKVEAEILRARVLHLEKELKETQDFVFSMQPRTQKLSEADAVAEFTSLCNSIEEWVQTKLGDSIEAIIHGKERVSLGQPARILLSIIPPPGREAFRYRDTDEYNIIALIMRCLCDWIMDKDFYCNIEKGGMDFLNSLERSMRNLEPKRDHITCRTWRSETYLAITNRHSFQAYRNKLREQVAYDLTHILHIFVPRLDHDSMGSSLLTAIVDPALALAHKLHLSVDKYSIRWTPYHTSNWEQRQSMNLNFNQFECLDLLGGRTVKFPPTGKLITYLFDLAPALVLETAQSQFFGEPKVLKKPRILVAATKETEGYYDPVLPKQGDPFTLLGYMEERLHSRTRLLFG